MRAALRLGSGLCWIPRSMLGLDRVGDGPSCVKVNQLDSYNVAMPLPIYTCPKCKTKIPFGTADKPAPAICTGCHKGLDIPSWYREIPEWIIKIAGKPPDSSK